VEWAGKERSSAPPAACFQAALCRECSPVSRVGSNEFRADPGAKTEASESYLRYYFVKNRSLELKMFWPEYVCALGNDTVEGFRSCMCAGAK